MQLELPTRYLTGGANLPGPSIPAVGLPDHLGRSAEIREDPQVKKLAHTWAGDPDVAEDALREAYWALAKVEHPERIEDLRKCFLIVVTRKAYRLRGQLGAAAVAGAGETG